MTPEFAGLALDRPHLIGILHVTPDSFADGGKWRAPAKAIEHGLAMREEGASIIDIGGESTRPGAAPVSAAEEIDRILPVIEGLSKSAGLISVDTRTAAVMEAALKAGAHIINDISALTHDRASAEVVRRHKPAVILMHMQGTPQTMQKNPVYKDVVVQVHEFLKESVAFARSLGLGEGRIAVDVGIGFGKTAAHNLALLQNLSRFQDLEPMVLGVSRKSFIEALTFPAPPDQRLGGTIAAILAAYRQGVMLHRVHDVAALRQALALFSLLRS